MRKLDSAGLAHLPGDVAAPSYDRSEVVTSIVHVGVGGFHRAHQAMYLDRLMQETGALDWGVCGVGLLPGDRRMRDVLQAQDCLYTLVLKHPDGRLEPRIVGSIVEYLFAPDDPDAVIEKIAAPTTTIVSLTITEGGYNPPPEDDDGVHVFSLLTDALERRRDRALPGLTVMSCDNIQGNGQFAHAAFVSFAGRRDASLANWMEREVSFPNSMVDRITPATTDGDRSILRETFGIQDGWPVVSEPFAQWVLEDRFVAGRPRLEDVGVQVVDDVEPYEQMKLRLLNASHQAIGYLGYLAGYRHVHEVCSDPLFTEFVRG